MTYRAEAGSVNDLSAGVSLATAEMDFRSEEQSVILDDGQQSAVIAIVIADVSNFAIN